MIIRSVQKWKNVSKFLLMGFPKELVTIVSVESILIDIISILEPFEKTDTPRGTILKNRINILITLSQTIGHKVL